MRRECEHPVQWSILCIAQDGMDQAKFRTPRSRKKPTKLYQQLRRPALHCAASWCHGWCLRLAIADENLKKDSQCSLEQLSRTLDSVLQEAGSLASGVNLQQDNTYREGKDQYVAAFAILTIALGCFRHFTLSYLRKGHSPLYLPVSLKLAFH